jgi:hypothetical protein
MRYLSPFKHRLLHMRKTLTSVFILASLSTTAQSPVSIIGLDSTSIQTAISNLIFGGCVQVSNVTYTGHARSFGVMLDPSGQFGMDTALVISTGVADSIEGAATDFIGSNMGTSGDADLSSIASFSTYDAAILEFDFTPASDTIYAGTFFFGSEEYPEFVNSSFNDVFAFHISGPGISGGPLNIAYLPGSTTPITINNVNDQLNSQYYIDNQSGTVLRLDGLTVPVQLEYPVEPGQTYHFKVAIADAGDGVYDSGVFLRAQSFCGSFWVQQAEFVPMDNGDLSFQFMNYVASGSTSYVWDFGDGTTSTEASPAHIYALPGQYTVTLTASNACQQVSQQQVVNASLVGMDVASQPGTLRVLNGADGQIRVNYSAPSAHHLGLSVLALDGREVMNMPLGTASEVSRSIDLSGLPTGVYLISLMADDHRHMARVVR